MYYLVIFLFVFLAGGYSLFANNIIRPPSDEIATVDEEEIKVPEETKIEKKVFGQSQQGKNIEGYEIGSGKDSLLIFAAIHGNEMGTADLLNRLVLEISLDPDIVSQSKKLIIIPVANPDGYEDRTDKLNASGVNLNLNFATSLWEQYGPEGNYAGPAPFSESESRVIRDLVEQYKPKAMISFHAHGNLISPEAGEPSVALAKWYSARTGYEFYGGWDYSGTATKWFKEMTGNPAITVEISKDYQSDWEINKGALLELISSDNLPISS
ncbi:MAG: M14 family zinc carboxypeptidase [Candidatus Paceibacterota bacterium]